MKREMSAFALVLAVVLLCVYLFNLGPTGFVVQSGTSNFASASNSSFVNTTYDGSSILLLPNATSGNYLSEIFGNGNNSILNNLTWVGNVSSNSSIAFQVANCSLADCSDAVFTSPADLNNLNLSGDYFQYKVIFSRDDSNVTSPSLTGVSYVYSPVETSNTSNSTETLVINSPTSTTYNNATQLVNISAAGADSIWYNWNGTNETYNGSAYVTFPDGSNTLTAYANDTNGTVSSQSVSFTISVQTCNDNSSVCTQSQCDTLYDPSNWYNGACHDSPQQTTQTQTNTTTQQQQQQNTTQTQTPVTPKIVTQLSASDIPSTDIVQGNSKNIDFSVQNTGTTSLTGCALQVTGNSASWFNVSNGSEALSAGQSATFTFGANVPLNASVTSYTATAAVDCAETSASKDFTINVLQNKLNITILGVRRNKLDNVEVSYSLADLIGQDQNVSVMFDIVDANGTEVGNASANDSLSANDTKNFQLNVPVNASANGNMSLTGTFGSEQFSTTVLEPILLGAPVSGFTIGGLDFGTTGGYAAIGGLAVVIVLLFFGIRYKKKIRKKKASHPHHEESSGSGESSTTQ